MVDALEIAHSLLRPEAALLNIQPFGKPRPLEIRSAAGSEVAGEVGHRLKHANQVRARQAVEEVTARGLFKLEAETTLPYLSYYDSPGALDAHYRANSVRSYLEPAVLARAQALASAAGGPSQTIVRETLYMCRLRRLEPVQG